MPEADGLIGTEKAPMEFQLGRMGDMVERVGSWNIWISVLYREVDHDDDQLFKKGGECKS